MRWEHRLIPQNLVGDLRRGGWRWTGKIAGDTDAVSYGDNWRLMAKSGSGYLDSDWREIVNGHILAEPDNISFDRYDSEVQVNGGTMQELLMGESIQDIGFTDQVTPLNDHQITNMTFGLIIDHIIKRHCNVVYDATTMPDGVITDLDISTSAASIPVSRYNLYKSGNMWRAMQDVGGGEDEGVFHRCWFDRRNKFYFQLAPPFWTTPPTAVGTLDKQLILDTIKVERNANQPGQRLGQANITAIKDWQTIYTAKYPTPAEAGKIMTPKDGIWTNSQATTDTQVERLYKWETRPYTLTVEVDPALILFGDDGRGLDLSDKVLLTYDGPGEDAVSGAGVHLSFSAQSFFVYGANIKFDADGHAAKGTLSLEYDPT